MQATAKRGRRRAKTADDYMEALARARSGHSQANYLAVLLECRQRGYDDVRPYENVLTFDAWRALGRTVRKGEKGIRVTVYRTVEKQSDKPGEKPQVYSYPASSVVFHEAQTTEWTQGAKAVDNAA